MKKELIVCADDFGFTRGVNKGIVECFKNGILRSASLMANGAALEHAVELAATVPELDLGIHLCINDLSPLCPELVGKELVNDNGRYFSSFSKVVKKLIVQPRVADKIKEEFRSQIEFLLSRNVRLSHINSHKHIHIYPQLWQIVIDLAGEYKIPFVRYPLEKMQRLYKSVLKRRKGRKKTARDFVFFSAFFLFFFMHYQSVKLSISSGELCCHIPDFFYGLYDTGFLDEDTMADMAGAIRPGINEFMCHPGYIDNELLNLPTRLIYSREKEVDLLCSSTVKEVLEENDVCITSFQAVLQKGHRA